MLAGKGSCRPLFYLQMDIAVHIVIRTKLQALLCIESVVPR
jgi:hypothetical protein